MHQELVMLKEMHQKLTLDDFPVMKNSNTYKEIKINGAVIRLYGLYKKPPCAICLAESPKDYEMEEHIHKETETLGLIRGNMTVYFNHTDKKIMKSGDVITIPPNTPHRVKYHDNCFQWAVTMPASDSFPEGVHHGR